MTNGIEVVKIETPEALETPKVKKPKKAKSTKTIKAEAKEVTKSIEDKVNDVVEEKIIEVAEDNGALLVSDSRTVKFLRNSVYVIVAIVVIALAYSVL